MSAADAGRDQVLVGVVVRVHGLRGEVVVEPHTDSPSERFAAGAVFDARTTRGESRGSIEVRASRPHSGRLLVTFAGVDDRDAAEALRGLRLLLATSELPPADDPDEFHVHQLEGLPVELADGSPVGTVREVVHGPGGELLVLRRSGADDALVPFVSAIVPTVDLDTGRIVIDPPEGLLDPVD
ncbi:ribosome maturation factor RimM [Pseudonocardia endophytica]|uniref:Ribosome maturation factor RimM n=1 Tax=Pseudonocardia endophytica TaxID=401976 RepID=A0A4R1HZA2_PSEEN|nr:ribosome maturation factor RimM [Pseudonocardia endophytica]TCK25459.1 16S rRNA processing protein RimM [Pseudonocardia endophytica]